MGVPSFYRWLANKYPKIVVNAIEKNDEEDGLLPNPNGIEFDNLYLDMNGIIHPCFHPENDDVLQHVETYDEVFENIFEYIDRIMNIVRPRKLLYMAIDGVAPRAKMNQQRSRRFRTAKDQDTLKKEEDKLRKEYENEGKEVLPEFESEVSDSNVITPGTEFMYELSKQLQTYIWLRITQNLAWKQLKVILSDANSPGEGEHKIMSFIRLQRTCPGYNPNTSHVLYGLDADLIMLALATHEIHFSILRENVLVEDNSQSNSRVAEKAEYKFDLDRGLKETAEQMSSLGISKVRKTKSSVKKKPYQFLHLWILREYLNLDIKVTNIPEKFELDMERLIDDFIFICFFAGNDFLPNMPTLEINEGALDLLLHVYKQEFKNLGGYLVDMQRVNDKKGGYIKLKRVEKFILAVGAYEDKIFKKRSDVCEKKLRRVLLDIQDSGDNGEADLFPMPHTCNEKGSSTRSIVGLPSSSRSPDHDQIRLNTILLKEKLKSNAREASDVWRTGLVTDTVKFGSPGWKPRYYKYKFSAVTNEDVEKMRKKLVEKYTEGLCWVLLYYFSGVPSWTWFFPYHYGPFASDLKGLSSMKVVFQKGTPFKPYDQLMAVLPSTSGHALPVLYQSLMTDEGSSILDFYPSDFDVDTDGKRFAWQGICKLSFIDEERLLVATREIEKELSYEEANRNVESADLLFLHSSESFASQLVSTINKIEISGEINGFVSSKIESIEDSNALCVRYDLPSFRVHVPRVLEGTTIPETVVNESDIEEGQLWHDIHGYQGRNSWTNNRNESSKRSSPGVGSRNCYPDIIIKGGGSGWSGRGRVTFSDATRSTLQEQTGGQSWWNTRGRGARGYGNTNNHPARNNDQVWSVKTDSRSGQKKVLNQWGDAQTQMYSGDTSNRRW